MSATTMAQNSKIKPRRVVSHKFRAQDFVRRRNNEKVTDHYTIGRLLGEGQFGEVFLGTVIKSNGGKGDIRAVKRIQKELLSIEDHEEVFNEFLLLKQMDHPNICKMYEFFEDDESFWFVQEFCGGGELFDELERIDIFPESSAALIMKQVLGSVHYCHTQKRVVHRDLKLENILLEGPQSCEADGSYKPMVVKLIDFGLGTHFQKDQYLTAPRGSMHYIAPEVLEQHYNYKCDIWSCGVILYIMLSGYAPFEAANDRDMRELIMMGYYNFNDPVWENVSDEAKDFISYLLTYDPEKRPDAAQALQHPWIQNAYKAHAQQFKGTKRGTDAAVKFLSNCRSFEAASKLKQATCAFMTSQLVLSGGDEKQGSSNSDSADGNLKAGTIIGEIFRAMDLDADGRLSRDELVMGFMDFLSDSVSSPLTVEEVDDVFQRINLSSSGFIEYSEFVVACMGLHDQNEPQNQELLKQAFERLLDRDGSGFISHAKLRKEMAPFYGEDADEAIIRKIIDQADNDKDGQISWDDFQIMMAKTANFIPSDGATPLSEYKYVASGSTSGSAKSRKAAAEPTKTSKSLRATLPFIATISEEDEKEEVEPQEKMVQATAEMKSESSLKDPLVVQPVLRRRSSANGPKARLISAIYEKNLESNRARGLDPFSYMSKPPEQNIQKRKLPRTRRVDFEELMKKANTEIKFDAKAVMDGRNAEIAEFKTTNAGRARERQSSIVTMLQQEKQDDKREVRLQELEILKGQQYNAKERRDSLENSFADTMTRRLELIQREKQLLELENVKKSLRDDHAAKKKLFESWHKADQRVSKVEKRSSRIRKLEELKNFQETFEPTYPLKTNATKIANRRESVPASAVHRRPSRQWTKRVSGKALVRDSIEKNIEDKETAVEVRRMFDRSASHAVLSIKDQIEKRLYEMQPKAKTKKSARRIEPIRRLNSFDSDQEQEERDRRLDEMAPVEEGNASVPQVPESLNRSAPQLLSIPEDPAAITFVSPKRGKRNSLSKLSQIFEKSPEKPNWLQTRATTYPHAIETKPSGPRAEELKRKCFESGGVSVPVEKQSQADEHQLPSVSIKPRNKIVTINTAPMPASKEGTRRHSIGVQVNNDAKFPISASNPEKSPISPEKPPISPVSVTKDANNDCADKKELDLHQVCVSNAATPDKLDTNENSMVGLAHTGTVDGDPGCSFDSLGADSTTSIQSCADSVSSDAMSPKPSKMDMSAPELGGSSRRKRRSTKKPHRKIITPKNEPRMRPPGEPTTPTPGSKDRRLTSSSRRSMGIGGGHLGKANRRASATATMTNTGTMTEEQKQFLQMAKDRAMKSKLVD